jgi:hypothetical protein
MKAQIPLKHGQTLYAEKRHKAQGFELLVDPNCEHARDELRCYSWPTDRLTGQVISGVNPVGVADHVIDAIRYAVEDLIRGASLNADDDDDDGGVIRIPLWRSSRDPRELPWHQRARRWQFGALTRSAGLNFAPQIPVTLLARECSWTRTISKTKGLLVLVSSGAAWGLHQALKGGPLPMG